MHVRWTYHRRSSEIIRDEDLHTVLYSKVARRHLVIIDGDISISGEHQQVVEVCHLTTCVLIRSKDSRSFALYAQGTRKPTWRIFCDRVMAKSFFNAKRFAAEIAKSSNCCSSVRILEFNSASTSSSGKADNSELGLAGVTSSGLNGERRTRRRVCILGKRL
ncbi:hypothetical protein PC113_g8313 [Phytophthora cactorum]|nr:hypothetical protein PC113_g8313 [Phytophthora cactorum]